MGKNITVCIDFDGTCVTHEFPKVGDDIGAQRVLKTMTSKGIKLVLFTMRSGKELEDAVKWFEDNNIPLYGINKNPAQINWTKSPKAYGHIYIDDAALGCPLIKGDHERPYVNWAEVEALLKDTNHID